MKYIFATFMMLASIACTKLPEKVMHIECPAFPLSAEVNPSLPENQSIHSTVYKVTMQDKTVLLPRALCIAIITNE